jgi:hypothetical protein
MSTLRPDRRIVPDDEGVGVANFIREIGIARAKEAPHLGGVADDGTFGGGLRFGERRLRPVDDADEGFPGGHAAANSYQRSQSEANLALARRRL